MEGVHDPSKEAPKDHFTVKRHELEESDKSALEVMSSTGAASTTKQIVSNSIASRKKLMMLDPVLN